MVSASRALAGQLVETARNESTVQYTLTLSLKPDAPAGIIRDEIRLLTNDPETASIPIPVTALIRGDLVASPSVLALGRVTSAGGAQGRFLVRASKPFTIVSVEGTGDGFSVAPVDVEQGHCAHRDRGLPARGGRTRGDLKRTFRVVTDLPGEPSAGPDRELPRRALTPATGESPSRPISAWSSPGRGVQFPVEAGGAASPTNRADAHPDAAEDQAVMTRDDRQAAKAEAAGAPA